MTAEAGRRESRLGWPMLAIAAALLALTLAVRLIPAWALATEVADIGLYRAMAETVLRGDNVYARPIFFPYTPYSQFLPAAMLRLAEVSGWRFDFTMKLPSIALDGVVTVLVFAFLLPRAGPRRAVLWAAFWALNPVSILISAFHGNVMTLIPALVAAAYVAAEYAEDDPSPTLSLAISALLLGLAIALRSFPILVLPVFLLFATKGLRDALLYCALAGLATVLSSIPYLLSSRDEMLGEIFSYSGFPDFGWVSVLRAIPYLEHGRRLIFFDTVVMEHTKLLFLIAYAIALASMPLWRRTSLGRALLIAPLLFYGIYGGVGAQYLLWVIPPAVLARERLVLLFTPVATAALTAFYILYHGRILFGSFRPLIEPTREVVIVYVAANVLLVAIALAWTGHIVVSELRALRRSRPPQPMHFGRALANPWILRTYLAALLALCGIWLIKAGEAAGRGQQVLAIALERSRIGP